MSAKLPDLSVRFAAYVPHATNGEMIVMTEGGKPVANLAPYRAQEAPPWLEALVQRGEILLATKRLTLPQHGTIAPPAHSLTDILIKERRADRLFG